MTASNVRFTGSIVPQHGVVTLFGYGSSLRVDRGHLTLEDGIGQDRRRVRFPRVGHELKRLVVIGSDGIVSFAALRWLADQNAAFVMLNRDGSVLLTTGPVRSSDARLRRAQALAHNSGAALRIARELISQKLAAQAQVARERLLDDPTADAITKIRAELDSALTVDRIRYVESKGAIAYWSLWKNLPITFPKKDTLRVPAHWASFGARESQISGSPRLAINPPNAILNYLYATLESEARLAAAALGLDPGLGFLHVDTPGRDSLACDLMEPVRPVIDAYLIDWITREPLRREWFFEQRNGNCRLMATLAQKLSETAPNWARAVAPFAEWVASILSSTKTSVRRQSAPTRLTHRHRSEGRGHEYKPTIKEAPVPQKICRSCGADILPTSTICENCHRLVARKQMMDIARAGRILAQSAEAQLRRGTANRKHTLAASRWKSTDNPSWLNEKTFRTRIYPRLAEHSAMSIASALGISEAYAADIRAGRHRPHPRHWQKLAELVSGQSLSPESLTVHVFQAKLNTA
jgi:CRISPR-associated endonuclease Cas1